MRTVSGTFDVRRLRLLRELQLRGSIAAVADVLDYTPSAVSQQLAVLERESGVALLERIGRGVRLTREGDILAGHAEIVIRQLDEAAADIARVRDEVSGTVRIAMFQSALHALLPAALDRLAEDHPQLRVEVRELDQAAGVQALLARDVDIALGEDYPGLPMPRPDGLQIRDLCRDMLRIAVPASLAPTVREAWSGRTTIRDLVVLADAPWVLDPPGELPRPWVEGLCRRAGFDPDVRYESVDVLTPLRLVESGHAVAMVPDLMWQVHQPKVALFAFPGAEQRRRVFTAVRHGTASHPSIEALRQALRDAVPAELAEEL